MSAELLAELRDGKRRPTPNEWRAILEAHAAWIGSRSGGCRAVLSGAVLSDADLSGAVLSRAVLSGADLSRAVLSGAVLSRAVLSRAVLSRAVLSDADLSRADLSGAQIGGIVVPDGARLVQVGPIGSRWDTTTAVVAGQAVVGIATGCFAAPADEFRAAVTRTHAAGSRHALEYAAALSFFEAFAAIPEDK